MTIEEAREQMINFEGTMECPSYEAVELVIKALEELHWYREQDLIPRKDALDSIENLKRSERHHDHVITLHHSYCAILEIPKIEPPNKFQNGTSSQQSL